MTITESEDLHAPMGDHAMSLPTSHRLLSAPRDLSYKAHLEHWGGLPAVRDLIAEIGRSGLRGRGGASFPTAHKIALLHDAARTSSGRPVIVANGCESEPLSAKDQLLLWRNAHLVLDGLLATAAALGADRAIVCLPADRRELVNRVSHALRERGVTSISLELRTVPERYLIGEETALINFLDHGRAVPTAKTVRLQIQGLGRRPTLVDNVETLAHIGLIARFGSSAWAAVGTPEDPGTALLTVGGAVAHPGILEVAHGTPLREVLSRAGAERSVGVLVGGYFGTWLAPADAARASLSRKGLAEFRAGLGCGAIAVLPLTSCPLAEVGRVMTWLTGQSAGQCGPCVNGLPAITGAFGDVIAAGDPHAVLDIERWSAMVAGRGACKLPDGAIGFVRSALAVFADHVDLHRERGRCPSDRPRFLPTPSWEAR